MTTRQIPAAADDEPKSNIEHCVERLEDRLDRRLDRLEDKLDARFNALAWISGGFGVVIVALQILTALGIISVP